MVDLRTLNAMIDYKWIRLKLSDGGTFEGHPVNIDYEDESASGENEICLEYEKNRFRGFRASEITSWEIPLANYGKNTGKYFK